MFLSRGRTAAGFGPDLHPIFSSTHNAAFRLLRIAKSGDGIVKCNTALANKVKLHYFSFSFEESRDFLSPGLIGFSLSHTPRAQGAGMHGVCGSIHLAHADGIDLLIL